MKHPMYAIIDRHGEEVGPRYGGPSGYDDAEDYRKANDILHPTGQVVEAPKRLPRRRS